MALLLAQPVGHMTITALATVHATAITDQVLAPALEGAQADADLSAGADQACMSDDNLVEGSRQSG